MALDPDLYYGQTDALASQLAGAAQSGYDQQSSALGNYANTLGAQQSGQGYINLPLLAFAAGIGAPTRTGNFFEGLSNGMKETLPYIQQGRQDELTRASTLAKIAQAKAQMQMELVQQKLNAANIPLQARQNMNQAMGAESDVDYATALKKQREGLFKDTPGQGQGSLSQFELPPVAAPVAAGEVARRTDGTGPAAANIVQAGKPPAPFDLAAAAAAQTQQQQAAQPPLVQQLQQAQAAQAQQAAAPAAAAAADIPVGQEAQQAGAPGATGYVIPGSAAAAAGAPGVVAQAQPASNGPTVVAAANRPPVAPAIPPNTMQRPMPQGYAPGPVQIYPGAYGYRPPAAIAKQLDYNQQMIDLARQYPLSAKAQAAAAAAAASTKQLIGNEGYGWDNGLKAIVPMGGNDPSMLYQHNKTSADATNDSAANHELVKVFPNGPNQPPVYLPRSQVLKGQPGEDGKSTPYPVEPSEGQKLQIKEYAETRAALPVKMAELNKTIAETERVQRLLSTYKTGTWNDIKGDVIGILRSAGIDTRDADSWSPAKAQEMTKYAMRQVFNDAKAQGGRLLVTEIEGFKSATYSPNMQPEANREIISELQASHKYLRDYYDDLGKWMREDPNHLDVDGFAAEWMKQPGHRYADYIKNELTYNSIVKGAEPIRPEDFAGPPPPDQRTPGMMINSPKGVVKWDVNQDGVGTWVPVTSEGKPRDTGRTPRG